MKSGKLKSKKADSPSPRRKRRQKKMSASERYGPHSWQAFEEAVRRMREVYDPGFGEFVRSLRDTDFFSGQIVSGKPK